MGVGPGAKRRVLAAGADCGGPREWRRRFGGGKFVQSVVWAFFVAVYVLACWYVAVLVLTFVFFLLWLVGGCELGGWGVLFGAVLEWGESVVWRGVE